MTNIKQVVATVAAMICALLMGALPAAAQVPVGFEKSHRDAVVTGGSVWSTCVSVFTLEKATAKCWLNAGRLRADGTFVRIDPKKVKNDDRILIGIPTPVLRTITATRTAPQPQPTTNTAATATDTSGATSVASGDKPQSPPEVEVQVPATTSTTAVPVQPEAKPESDIYLGTPDGLRPAEALPNLPAINQEALNRQEAQRTEFNQLAQQIAIVLVIFSLIVACIIAPGLAFANAVRGKPSGGKKTRVEPVRHAGVKTRKQPKLKPAKIVKTKPAPQPRYSRNLATGTDAFAEDHKKQQAKQKPEAKPKKKREFPKLKLPQWKLGAKKLTRTTLPAAFAQANEPFQFDRPEPESRTATRSVTTNTSEEIGVRRPSHLRVVDTETSSNASHSSVAQLEVEEMTVVLIGDILHGDDTPDAEFPVLVHYSEDRQLFDTLDGHCEKYTIAKLGAMLINPDTPAFTTNFGFVVDYTKVTQDMYNNPEKVFRKVPGKGPHAPSYFARKAKTRSRVAVPA